MNIQDLQNTYTSELALRFKKTFRKKTTRTFLAVFIASALIGSLFGAATGGLVYLGLSKKPEQPGSLQVSGVEYIPQTTQEQKIVEAVRNVSPAVVRIVITKNVPILEQILVNPFEEFFGQGSPFQIQVPQIRQKGTEKKEVGGGSGFIVSEDGFLITNKHVVIDKDAEYTVFTNDGKKYPAKVLAKDPLQDLAVLKIEQDKAIETDGAFTQKAFPVVKFGNSDALQIGQSVIAIGNALGEFKNTVSVGVISGLGRTITASGGDDFVETIEDVIQTDAAINKGNSGGPLLNLAGEVIGINTATVLDAQSIGFSIPANKAVRDVEQVRESNKIVYPFLGIRYALVTETLKEEKALPVNYGALVQKSSKGEAAVTPDSAADKAGIKEGDIVLEIDGERIAQDNSLAKIIQRHKPGDIVTLKVLREKEELTFSVTLGERTE